MHHWQHKAAAQADSKRPQPRPSFPRTGLRAAATDQWGEGMLMKISKQIGAGASGCGAVESSARGCAGCIPGLLPLKALVHQKHNLHKADCG